MDTKNYFGQNPSELDVGSYLERLTRVTFFLRGLEKVSEYTWDQNIAYFST